VSSDQARPPQSKPRSGTPRQRRYLFGAIGLVVIAVAAVVYAATTNPSSLRPKVDPNHLAVGPLVPPIAGTGWANSAPLSSAQLDGKVVLYDFWTYSCINCVDTIPYLRSWYERYRSDGFVVVGIHTPEFDFEMNHANVLQAIRSLGVTWPVAFDDHMKVWNAFGNDSWPADYVADRSGHLRYLAVGEGGYGQTENVIRALLGVASNSPRAASPSGAFDPGQATADITPETYLGVAHSKVARAGTVTYPPPTTVPVDTAELSGTWTGTADYVEAGSATSAISLHYQAQQVNLVLAPPASGPVSVTVELDGAPLPPAYRTSQTVVGSDGQTSVQVTGAGMYRLIAGNTAEGHTLQVTAGAPGLRAYDFTFEP
jgi:thiol-disulfide isomerase/thioredoxin